MVIMSSEVGCALLMRLQPAALLGEFCYAFLTVRIALACDMLSHAYHCSGECFGV
jgi:hypothetical protein